MFYHLSVRFSFWLHGLLTRRFLSGYDIYHVKSGLGRGGAIKAAHKLGMKILVDHCVPHPKAMQRSTGDKGYDEWWSYWRGVMEDCAEADMIMVGSQYVKETFLEFGYSPNKIKVVELGVLSMFNKIKETYDKTGPLKLIYTGMWAHHKGVHDLVDAVEILVRRNVAVELTVLGSYSENDSGYIKAQALHLPISFLGHIVQDDLRKHLANSDVYVFPSLRDGFAVSAFEGMSAGLCLITTKESSIPIRDGETGFYVPIHAPSAIADKIEYLNTNRDVIEKIGKQSAEVVEKDFTWENYAKKVHAVYEELLRR